MRSSLFCAYFSRFSSEVCYYNLSPQGDGNLMRMSFPYFLPSITIYPRKGTVTGTCRHQRGLSSITTYPRKGTETGSSPLKNASTFNYNISPQGDKKAPPLLVRTSAEGLCFSGFFCFGVSGRAFRRGWPHQRESPRCLAGRSASGGGSHAGRRRSLARYL